MINLNLLCQYILTLLNKMNDTISLYAHLVSIDKDITLIQVKTHRDLLQIQTVGIERFNLFHFQQGTYTQVLSLVSREQLTNKIIDFATFESVEECLSLA